MRQVAALSAIYSKSIQIQAGLNENAKHRLGARFEIAHRVLPKLQAAAFPIAKGQAALHRIFIFIFPTGQSSFLPPVVLISVLKIGGAVSSSLSSRLPHRKPFGNNWRRGKNN